MWLAAAFAAVALTGSLAVTLWPSGGQQEASPQGPAVSDATRGPLRVGVSFGDRLSHQSPAQLAASLDAAQRLGIGWIRADLSWAVIQNDGEHRYDWSRFDRVVDAANARGLQVLPVVAYTPPWARPAGCTAPSCAPADPAAFATYAAAAATRYAHRGVRAWEIWNEPNMTGFFRPAPDPARYSDLLHAAATAIRAVDRDAFILAAGLAALATENGNINELDYLRALCQRGLGDVADAVAFHPYTYPHLPSFQAPWQVGTAWNRIDSRTPSLTSVLRADCGPRQPTIWLTEYGAPTAGPGEAATDPTVPPAPGVDHVTEQLQAEIAADAVRTAAADPVIRALFWYTDRDLSTERTTPENFYGLLRSDGSAKPSYDAFSDAVAALGQSAPSPG